jgi:hypothetical protein
VAAIFFFFFTSYRSQTVTEEIQRLLPDFCTNFESVRSHQDVFVAGKIFAAHSMGDENIPGDHI